MSGANRRKYGRIREDETGRKCPSPNILHLMIKISCADGTVVVLNCSSRKMLLWCMTWSRIWSRYGKWSALLCTSSLPPPPLPTLQRAKPFRFGAEYHVKYIIHMVK
ncbi:hypothetical protein CDAR_480991 [Caerostris darwini]|uniref:Ribosomal protein L14 n=1 Tax=Caerostris darwini TaxID=1538125 RepID=A0AAV4W6C1_9ARAC|nr:hypothetical protein CDAR_480991 [Caerostris darwini]